MNIKGLIFGAQFLRLIQEGRQTDRLVKNGGEALLKQSSPEQESTLNIQWYRLSLPNPFTIGIIIMLLEIVLAWGWATLTFHFQLSVKLSTVLLFSITPFMCTFAVLIPYRLGRGYANGLYLISYFYLFNILMTLAGFILTIIKSVEVNEWIKQLYFFPLQLLVIYLCRCTMNSNSFYKIITFFRTTRLHVTAKQERETQQKSIQ